MDPLLCLENYRPLLTREIKQIAALNRKIELLPCCCTLHGYIIDYSEQWLHLAQPSPGTSDNDGWRSLHCLDTRGCCVHFIWSFLLVIFLPNFTIRLPSAPLWTCQFLLWWHLSLGSSLRAPAPCVGLLSTNNQQGMLRTYNIRLLNSDTIQLWRYPLGSQHSITSDSH